MRKTKKLRLIMKRAKMGNPIAMYQLGVRYQLGWGIPANPVKAVEWISDSAEFGYAPAVDWMEDYSFDDDAQVQALS